MWPVCMWPVCTRPLLGPCLTVGAPGNQRSDPFPRSLTFYQHPLLFTGRTLNVRPPRTSFVVWICVEWTCENRLQRTAGLTCIGICLGSYPLASILRGPFPAGKCPSANVQANGLDQTDVLDLFLFQQFVWWQFAWWQFIRQQFI